MCKIEKNLTASEINLKISNIVLLGLTSLKSRLPLPSPFWLPYGDVVGVDAVAFLVADASSAVKNCHVIGQKQQIVADISQYHFAPIAL